MTKLEKRCEDCACLVQKSGVWCCDELWGRPCNDIAEDECPEEVTLEEVEEINTKAKNVKIDHGVANKPKAKTERKKPKVSDEKATLFAKIWSEIQYDFGDSAQILKENKLISVKIGDKTFKIDLIEQRQPKK